MKGGAINSYVSTINQNCPRQSGIFNHSSKYHLRPSGVTEGKVGGNGFNEEEKMGVVLNGEGKMGIV